MRPDVDHDLGRGVLVVALTYALVASIGCSKTWVLGATPGLGGMAGAASGGAGGGPGATSGTGGHGDGGGGRGACTVTTALQFTTPPAELVFVVGRNNSMMSKFGDTTRMTAVQMDVHNVVDSNDSIIDFGYQGFPSFTGCPTGGTCCSSTDDGLQTGPAAKTSIDQVLYHPCDSSGAGTGCVAQTDSRAVSQALSDVFDLFTSNDPSSERTVVLILDGPPGCPTEDPGKACGSAQSQANWLLTHLGIKTYVVGVGDQAQGDDCLQQLASQGGTSNAYSALDPSALMKTLTQIVNVAGITCTVELKVPPPDPNLVQVLVKGKEVHYDPTGSTGGGWSYLSFGGSTVRIELHGSACALLSSPSQLIQVWSGCAPCTVQSSTCL